jgi:hypothetical protein
LHQLVLKPPGSVGRDSKPPAQLDVGYSLLALAKQMHRYRLGPVPASARGGEGEVDR